MESGSCSHVICQLCWLTDVWVACSHIFGILGSAVILPSFVPGVTNHTAVRPQLELAGVNGIVTHASAKAYAARAAKDLGAL